MSNPTQHPNPFSFIPSIPAPIQGAPPSMMQTWPPWPWNTMAPPLPPASSSVPGPSSQILNPMVDPQILLQDVPTPSPDAVALQCAAMYQQAMQMAQQYSIPLPPMPLPPSVPKLEPTQPTILSPPQPSSTSGRDRPSDEVWMKMFPNSHNRSLPSIQRTDHENVLYWTRKEYTTALNGGVAIPTRNLGREFAPLQYGDSTPIPAERADDIREYVQTLFTHVEELQPGLLGPKYTDTPGFVKRQIELDVTLKFLEFLYCLRGWKVSTCMSALFCNWFRPVRERRLRIAAAAAATAAIKQEPVTAIIAAKQKGQDAEIGDEEDDEEKPGKKAKKESMYALFSLLFSTNIFYPSGPSTPTEPQPNAASGSSSSNSPPTTEKDNKELEYRDNTSLQVGTGHPLTPSPQRIHPKSPTPPPPPIQPQPETPLAELATEEKEGEDDTSIRGEGDSGIGGEDFVVLQPGTSNKKAAKLGAKAKKTATPKPQPALQPRGTNTPCNMAIVAFIETNPNAAKAEFDDWWKKIDGNKSSDEYKKYKHDSDRAKTAMSGAAGKSTGGKAHGTIVTQGRKVTPTTSKDDTNE
ncbi:hypothetical protein BDN72DRAFT_906542 [Pluteus cervinus]|uniref:Uncharacterized protein n=1 Tax=Pluteus cervinus TaxID=181527 RepID=A0ACD2ZZ87_9AGAR|nr:hypothetical protein BDN72DRAFT_906542 [Pluteus cervinus]